MGGGFAGDSGLAIVGLGTTTADRLLALRYSDVMLRF